MVDMLDPSLELPTTIKDNPPKGVFWGWIEVRKLPKTSAYAGFPIFHKMKITQVGYVQETDRADAYEYWQPFQNADKRIFNIGDDSSGVLSRITTPTTTSFFGGSSKSDELEFPGTRKSYGGKQYIATTKRMSWDSINPTRTAVTRVDAGIFMAPSGSKSTPNTQAVRTTDNPYSYKELQLWILDAGESGYSFTDSSGSTAVSYFWYHPTQKRFYPVYDSTAEQSISTATSVGANLGSSYVSYIASLLGDSVSSNPKELARFVYGLIPPNSPSLAASLKSGLISYLVKNQLLSVEAAVAAVAARGLAATPKDVTVGGKKQVPTTKRKKQNKFTVPTGGQLPNSYPSSLSYSSESSAPQMVQYYTVDGNNETVSNRHIFMFPPNQISYSGIGSQWNDIDRSGSTPLVDWAGFKLMQVSFQFLLAPDKSGSFDERGSDSAIVLDVEEEIRNLRRMAVAPYPVTLLGFDSLLSEQIGFPYIDGRGVEFVIGDFSISSLYRTSDGKINRAQCDITLREIPTDAIPLVSFPTLKIPGQKKKPTIRKAKEGSNSLFEDTSTEYKTP